MAELAYQAAKGYRPNHAVVPTLVNTPTVFLAPAAHTVSSGEIWIAVSCHDKNYGGCIIHASNDDQHYLQIGRLQGNSNHGLLTSALPSATGIDTTHTLAVDVHLSKRVLESVSQITFDTHDAFCYVGGEFLTYKTAQLTGIGLYSLRQLARGLYGSTPGAAQGAPFVFCDDTLFKYRFNKKLVGKTIYLKFQGFNGLGRGLQNKADLVAYPFEVTADGGIKALLSDLMPFTDDINALRATVNNLEVGSAFYQFIEVTKSIVGTMPLLATEFVLPAGTYSEFKAVIGTDNLTDTAVLQIRLMDGSIIKTLTHTGVPAEIITTGFILEADTLVGFYLLGATPTTTSFIFSLGVK